ncbi:hypothetical protein ACQPYK_38985 [Streptosporangium sp. CA-135522]|uniref:hypothetical protein n=1 Tax=Streptosporangium sp. CA-135522 TaxID=3240072 RepID=UPI003D94B459
MAETGNPRLAAVALIGMSLVVACSPGRTAAPIPTAPSPTAPSTAPPVMSQSPGPGRTTVTGSPEPSETATGAVTASAAWAATADANLTGSSALLDVAATGPRDAWAVGYKDSAEDREGTPAVLRWDGDRWREAPPVGDDAYHLEGVSAGGPDDVWVVGNGESAFAAHWNGGRWQREKPFGVAEDYRLADVATTGDATWFAANAPAKAVVLEWDGKEFRTALSTGGAFKAVTAKEGHIWAVGSSEKRTPLIWHGTAAGSWEAPEIPEIPGGRLNRVWQISPSDVWAVGEVVNGPDDRAGRPLVLHRDGSGWSRVEVPVRLGTLRGVTAFGPDDLWISGIDADHAGQALFLRFDGARWSREYGPLLRAHEEDQQYEETDDVNHIGIARVPGTTTLWAVGSVGVGDDEEEFVLRR